MSGFSGSSGSPPPPPTISFPPVSSLSPTKRASSPFDQQEASKRPKLASTTSFTSVKMPPPLIHASSLPSPGSSIIRPLPGSSPAITTTNTSVNLAVGINSPSTPASTTMHLSSLTSSTLFSPSRPSTPLSSAPAPPAPATPATTTAGPAPAPSTPSAPAPNAPVKEDPNDFSDALLSAGVDLREEEQLLSSSIPRPLGPSSDHARSQQQQAYAKPHTLYAGASSGVGAHVNVSPQIQIPIAPPRTPFLDLVSVRQVFASVAAENDMRPPPFLYDHHHTNNNNTSTASKELDSLLLISLACREWLADILTAAVITSRYRRESGARTANTSNASDVAKTMRQIAIRDKESQDRYAVASAALELRHGNTGPDGKVAPEDGGSSSAGGSAGKGGGAASHLTEEVMHRAANATAALMVSGGKKKRYSWMSGGANSSASKRDGLAGSFLASPLSSSSSSAAGGSMGSSLSSQSHGIRIREAREEQAVVLRDLLSVLENERFGVENALTKGWARLRD
ncbi:transcription initiation factor TFIID component TAF4 family-domain-containing protein [Lipomyces japonicus]|uniref:transcription initiation factor TFIID component TAF4 family-domain-containing protein n=1 Tax=Lipomyces japonicus TaxID=56871 RepID=UPI0034CFE837